MTWFSASIVFLISWWIVFLAVLPIGVQGQHETQDVTEGTEPGAPQQHMLPKKALWALYGAIGVTILAFLVALSGIIPSPTAPWG